MPAQAGAPELSVVMPVFKEGESVEPVLRALTAAISGPHEILVVYDFDEDPTVPVIDRLSSDFRRSADCAMTWAAACSTR